MQYDCERYGARFKLLRFIVHKVDAEVIIGTLLSFENVLEHMFALEKLGVWWKGDLQRAG